MFIFSQADVDRADKPSAAKYWEECKHEWCHWGHVTCCWTDESHVNEQTGHFPLILHIHSLLTATTQTGKWEQRVMKFSFHFTFTTFTYKHHPKIQHESHFNTHHHPQPLIFLSFCLGEEHFTLCKPSVCSLTRSLISIEGKTRSSSGTFCSYKEDLWTFIDAIASITTTDFLLC